VLRGRHRYGRTHPLRDTINRVCLVLAHSSDSSAPSTAMVSAAPSRLRISSKDRPMGCPSGPGCCQGQAKLGSIGGMPLPATPSMA
jgi:hypothetical protein